MGCETYLEERVDLNLDVVHFGENGFTLFEHIFFLPEELFLCTLQSERDYLEILPGEHQEGTGTFDVQRAQS